MTDKLPAVILEGVSFARGSNQILEDIQLIVPAGELLGIIGPNGAGKTTLLHLLLGFLRPATGSIQVLGQDPCRMGTVRRQLGYLPQQGVPEGDFPVSVSDVVRMGMTPLHGTGRSKRVRENRAVEEILARFNLQELKNKPIGRLSGGQRQLAVLARALVHRPRLLLADEPTTGLDQRAREMFYCLIEEMQSQTGMTVIIVTHDLVGISAYARRLAYLDKTLIMTGEPRKVIDSITAWEGARGGVGSD